MPKRISKAEQEIRSMAQEEVEFSPESLLALLKKNPAKVSDLARHFVRQEHEILEAIGNLHETGYLVTLMGDKWTVTKAPPTGTVDHIYESDKDGWYHFGCCSDQHLGSKYERLDVLEDVYDRFLNEGVTRVYNSGNWIEGESRFNKHELLIHGMDAQLDYLVEKYPEREGIDTYAIAGDDHEGWYAQREGINIGKHAATRMVDAGRTDWHDLGYIECFVQLKHKQSGKTAQMSVMHPGGGSSYAVSYRPQKIVESFAGGEKPAVLLIGHYHKMSYNVFRNVHCLQPGTTQDQSTFMRKKQLHADVGACVCWLHQDEKTGAIDRCRVEFWQYFVKGYYNNRWNMGGKVTQTKRK